jgi:hypothetical protein
MQAIHPFLLIYGAAVALTAVPTVVRAQAQPPNFAASARQISFSGYTGEFANDPRYIEARRSMIAKAPQVLENIYRLTGLYLPQGWRVNVVFISRPKSGWPYGVTTPVGGNSCRIDFYLLSTFQDRQNPLEVFQHEMMHVMLISWMRLRGGQGADTRAPLWLHEAIATYVGGHGPATVRRYYLMTRNSMKSDDAESIGRKLFNGLGVHSSAIDYAEDYLGFHYIAETWGADVMKQIIQDIVNLVPWQQAISRATKLEWKAFAEGAKNFSIAYIKELELELNQKRRADAGLPQ